MNNIDPHNNIPQKREGLGATRDITGQFPQQPPMPMQQQGMDPYTENMLLKQDLDLAISYIQQLGGSWPPQQGQQQQNRPMRSRR